MMRHLITLPAPGGAGPGVDALIPDPAAETEEAAAQRDWRSRGRRAGTAAAVLIVAGFVMWRRRR